MEYIFCTPWAKKSFCQSHMDEYILAHAHVMIIQEFASLWQGPRTAVRIFDVPSALSAVGTYIVTYRRAAVGI